MKLYYSKGACSLAVRITLHEAEIEFASEAVNLKTKQTEGGKNYLDINPKGSVPALQLDNGEILTEGNVIQVWLADHYGVMDLLPPLSDFRRYRVLEWLNFISTELHKNCSPLFNPEVPEALRETVFRPLLQRKLNTVEQYLQKQVYLGGESVSLADSYLFVILRWLGALKVELAKYPALLRYFNQMTTRPSVQKALQEEMISA